MKKCPYCAEEIQDEAIKCKHCGSAIKNTPDAGPQPQAVLDESQDKKWAVVAHLGGLVPVLFLSLIIPLLIWLLKGHESAFVEKQAKEALNFQISLTIYGVVAVCIAFTIIGIPLTILAFIIFGFTNLICSLKGAIRTSQRITYTYPMNLRLIH